MTWDPSEPLPWDATEAQIEARFRYRDQHSRSLTVEQTRIEVAKELRAATTANAAKAAAWSHLIQSMDSNLQDKYLAEGVTTLRDGLIGFNATAVNTLLGRARKRQQTREAELTAAQAEVTRLQGLVAFHSTSLERVAKAAGIDTPMQLIGLAENNEETFVDLLVKAIQRKTQQHIRTVDTALGWRPTNT